MLVCVGAASAQVTVKAFAETELRASATLNEFGGRFWYDYKRIPIGKDLGTGLYMTAQLPANPYRGSAVAVTGVTVSASTLSVTVADTASTSFSGNPLPTRQFSALCGGHEVAILFTAGVPTAGYLEVVANGSSPGSAKLYNRTLDSGTAAVLTRRPLKVVVSSGVNSRRFSSGQHFQDSRVTVRFRPSAGVLRTIGSPCGPEFGAVYERTATLKPQHLTLLVSGSSAPVYGLYAFGIQSLSLPLPPLGCVLRTNPLVTVPASVTSTGEATLALPLPATVGIGQYFIQYAAVVPHAGGTAWTMSNALELRVQ
jgi:hypothetical protein